MSGSDHSSEELWESGEEEGEEKLDWKDDENIILKKVFVGNEATVSCVLFYERERRVVTASYDNSIRFWDYETCTCLKILKDSLDDVNQLIMWSDETFLSCNDDGNVVEYSVITMDKVRIIFDDLFPICRMLKINPQLLCCAGEEQDVVLLIDVSNGTILDTYNKSISSDYSALLASKKDDKNVFVNWDISDAVTTEEFDLAMLRITDDNKFELAKEYFQSSDTEGINTITLLNHTREGYEALIGGSTNGTVYIWDTASPTKSPPLKSMYVPPEKVRILATSISFFYKKNPFCLIGSNGGEITLIDLEKTEIVFVKRVHIKIVCDLFLIPPPLDSDYKRELQLVTGSGDNTARIFSMNIRRGYDDGSKDTKERVGYLQNVFLSEEDHGRFFRSIRVTIAGFSMGSFISLMI